MDFENESIEFWGFRLAWRKARSGKSYPHCEPSAKSCGKLRKAIREETTRSTQWKKPEEVIACVNQRVRGDWLLSLHQQRQSVQQDAMANPGAHQAIVVEETRQEPSALRESLKQ